MLKKKVKYKMKNENGKVPVVVGSKDGGERDTSFLHSCQYSLGFHWIHYSCLLTHLIHYLQHI